MKKLSPTQVRTITALVAGEKLYISGPTANVLIQAGLAVPTTEQSWVNETWTSELVPTIDAKRFA